MLIDTYYWFFSTVPQVLIALVVFCGALLIYYISKLNGMIQDIVSVTPLAAQVFIRYYIRYLGTDKEIKETDERYKALETYRRPGLVDPVKAVEKCKFFTGKKKDALKSFYVNLGFSSLGIICSLWALFFADILFMKTSSLFQWIMFAVFVMCFIALGAAIYMLAQVANTYALPMFDPELYKAPGLEEFDEEQGDDKSPDPAEGEPSE